MKIKLLQIFTNWPTLQKVAAFEIDAASAIRLSRFMMAAQQELELIENARQKLIQRYGIELDGKWQILPDHHQDFLAAFNTILQDKIEIYDPRLSSGILDGQRLSAVDFFAIAWLFDRDSMIGLIETVDPESQREE
ncbi:MAG: hypothetical protein EB117_12660 [Betaproteobacteria bacterium]|nr:hypothetical protein [Betaproteobacteria bacterium]